MSVHRIDFHLPITVPTSEAAIALVQSLADALRAAGVSELPQVLDVLVENGRLGHPGSEAEERRRADDATARLAGIFFEHLDASCDEVHLIREAAVQVAHYAILLQRYALARLDAHEQTAHGKPSVPPIDTRQLN